MLDESPNNKIAIIILAAGLGTRMNSDKAKVLHGICGKPMILHVVDASKKAAGSNVIVVVGYQAEKVKKVVSREYEVKFALQTEQLGTGHAVIQALPYLGEAPTDVIVLCGDVPLISAETLKKVVRLHRQKNWDVTIIGVKLENPAGYGRLILENNQGVSKIVEEKDATDLQKKIKIINTGIYCIKKDFLFEALPEIRSDNAQKEYYFTDIIEIANGKNKHAGVLIADCPEEVMGINTCQELETAQQVMKKSLSG